jgi:subtilisin family serine protease
LLQGEWVIAIGENQYFTFTTKLATRFDPESPTDYAIGRWVEAKVSRQDDGSFVAEWIRVDDHEVGELVVRLESSAYSLTLASKYDLLLMSTLLTQANIYLYVTDEEHEEGLVWQLLQEEGVIWAEVNYVNSVPEDDGYKTWGWGGSDEPDAYLNQSAYQQIHMGQSSRSYGGDGVVIAVLDTGIYTAHEQFDGHLQLPSLDVIDDDDDPSEGGPGLSWGHGTHVAGIIAAMAPNAKILPIRVLDENGRGNTFLLAYAIEWASHQPGVKVINLSLGTQFNSRILQDVIQKVVEQGIIVVAAAGNSNSSQVQYPAGYQDVVGVTAVGADSAKASFANFGAEWVDVAAPGVGIMSTMINEDGPGYATWSGTSMATAFVSGAAALLSQKWAVESAASGNILQQLVETGGLLDAINPGYAGQLGLLLDVSAALDVAPYLLFLPRSHK